MNSLFRATWYLLAVFTLTACSILSSETEPTETPEILRWAARESPQPTSTPTATPAPTPSAAPYSAALVACQKPDDVNLIEMLLTFVADWDGDREIYLANWDGSLEYQLTNDAQNDYSPRWSPDGNLLAWVSGTTLLISKWADAEAGLLSLETLYSAFDWSPESDKIVYVGNSGGSNSLWLVDVQSSAEVNLTGQYSFIPRAPSFSPDGDLILFRVDSPEGTDLVARWFTIRPDGGGLKELSFPGVFTYNANWHLDGSHIRFDGTSFSNGGIDRYVASLDGELELLRFDTIDPTAPTWSPDGTLIAYQSGNSIYLSTADETIIFPLLIREEGEPKITAKTWAPDNRRLAYNIYRTPDTSDLYMLDICDGWTWRIADAVESDTPPSFRARP
ncbi:MAG: TolB family protein [Anaerolineales bacterium]